jgi:hypothetical protein
MRLGKIASPWIVLITGSLSPCSYGVEASGIQKALDRYKVVGVISEESPRKPLAGIAVLQDGRTSQTHTLSIGDPLPNDPDISIISTKSGKVVVSDGKVEFALLHTETVLDPPPSLETHSAENVGGKWEENVSLLGPTYSRTKDARISTEGGLPPSSAGLTFTNDRGRFPYYKVDNSRGELDDSPSLWRESYTELDSFAQDWQWMPAGDLTIDEGPRSLDAESLREFEERSSNPWWTGGEEARSLGENEP